MGRRVPCRSQHCPVLHHACSVQYATGETEVLDLDEVVRDGHLYINLQK